MSFTFNIGLGHRPLRRDVLTGLLLLCFCLSGSAIEVHGSDPDEPVAIELPEVSQVVDRFFCECAKGGLAVLVTRDGRVIHSQGYGSVRDGEPVSSQTLLSLASVSKQFAAMCAAMLIEEGKLELTADVSTYLPDLDLPGEGREPKIQDLLWHTSGLPNFINRKEKRSIALFREQRGLTYLNNRTHAEWLTTFEPKRPPGQSYAYTNSGYVLLARIIEVLADEPFSQFQQRRIFDVLDMNSTYDSRRFNGSGNMRTTLEDYAKWDRALWHKDRRLLSEDGYELLFRRGRLDDGSPVNYGFGWKLTYEDGQLVFAEHGGWGSGTTAARNQIRRYEEEKTTVAVFAQECPEFGTATEQRPQLRTHLVDQIWKALP